MINSVLHQDYPDWELIIVDDASTDNPWSVLKPYISKYSNIKYFKHDVNKGYSAAKNTGIINSSGDYLAMLDADDMLTENSLSSRAKILMSSDKLWVHGQAYILDGKNKTADKRRNTLALQLRKKVQWESYYKCIHAQSVMVKKEFHQILGLYDEELRHSSDREMWMRALAFKIYPEYTQDFVCVYRMHANQMHRSDRKRKTKSEVLKQINIKIRKKLKNGINSKNTKLWL